MIQMRCPNCNALLRIEDKYIGVKGRCNRCQQIFTVPTQEELGSAAAFESGLSSSVGITPATPPPTTTSPVAENTPTPSNPFLDTLMPEVRPEATSTLNDQAPSGSSAALSVANDDPWEEATKSAPNEDFMTLFSMPAASPIGPPGTIPEGETIFGLAAGALNAVGPAAVEQDLDLHPTIWTRSDHAASIPPLSPEVLQAMADLERDHDSSGASIMIQPKPTPVAIEVPPLPTPMASPDAPQPAAAPKAAARGWHQLRIEAIDVFAVNLPTKATLHISGGNCTTVGQPTPRVYVKLVGENGVAGWGEVTPCPTWCDETTETIVTTLRQHLAPTVVGMSAAGVDAVHRVMDRAIRPGATIGQPLAKSGIDTALHDFLARTLEVPLHVLLGGARRQEIWLSYLVSATNPDEATALAKQAVGAGYTALKIKVGMNAESVDWAIIDAIAQGVDPSIYLWVDANQAYDLVMASRLAEHCRRCRVRVLEQPIPGIRPSLYRQLCQRTEPAIALDETVRTPEDLLEHVKHDAIHIAIMKMQRTGGHWRSLQFGRLAEAASIPMLGSGLCETDLGLAHSIQLFGALGIDQPCDLNGRQFLDAPFLQSTLSIKDSLVRLPDAVGVGVTVDEATLRSSLIPGWQ